MEKWLKDIPEYSTFEGYKITNTGEVYSYILQGRPTDGKSRIDYNIEPQLINQAISANGYYHISITDFNKRKYPNVHRLVALAFIPRVKGKDYVNHINGNKLDNRLENLEWVSFKENLDHAKDIGLVPRFANGRNKPVDQLTLDGEYIQTFDCLTDAANSLGFKEGGESAISKVCSGRQKTSGGYKWRYSTSC